MSSVLPEYFYLYLSMDDFGLRKLLAFLERKLPLTSPKRYNDPFDTKLALDHSNYKPEYTEEERRAIDGPWWNEDAIQQVKEEELEQSWQEMYNACVFSERNDSLLMWAHYADSHKGICLKFHYDETKLPAKCVFMKVRYSTHYPKLDSCSSTKEVEESFLLTKSVDWMYEHEWRFIAPTSDYGENGGFDGLVEVSPFFLDQVYFGECCERSCFESVEHLAIPIIGKERVDEVSEALDEFLTVHSGPSKNPSAWKAIHDALELLRPSDNDTVKSSNEKMRITRSIMSELINNMGLGRSVSRSTSEFRVKLGD